MNNQRTEAVSPLVRYVALAMSQRTDLVRRLWDINKWRNVGNYRRLSVGEAPACHHTENCEHRETHKNTQHSTASTQRLMHQHNVLCINTTSYATTQRLMQQNSILCSNTTSYASTQRLMQQHNVLCSNTTSYAETHRVQQHNVLCSNTTCHAETGQSALL